jgi:hypothetical protein
MGKSRRRAEFGDFQTPTDLANRVCRFLFEQGVRPASIVEPTCGEGNFLLTAIEHFESTVKAVGIEINLTYVERARGRLATRAHFAQVQVFQGDFFETNWREILEGLPDPVLVIGNPPWVTSSELSSLNSVNLPRKTNLQGLSGLDAKTGKSNFDISEWMLIHILEFLAGRDAVMALLCKTSVARKVLGYAWKRNLGIGRADVYLVDAKKEFDASVDACLLVCEVSAGGPNGQVCRVYNEISSSAYQSAFGYRNHRIIADIACYERWKHLEDVAEDGTPGYKWRSGIKHDCSKVMELTREEGGFRNQLGELHDLETTYLYPMLKSSDVASSDIANENLPQPSRWMLVPQRFIGDETRFIEHAAPKTWAYLIAHQRLLDGRRSSVYRGQPRFSVFGVGEYAFSTWKVAVSGLYKKLHFTVVGPYDGKPVVLDDTCYFIPCQSEREAQHIARLLNSAVAKEFFKSFIFWDAKRPITAGILKRLSLPALARELESEDRFQELFEGRFSATPHEQLILF